MRLEFQETHRKTVQFDEAIGVGSEVDTQSGTLG